MTSTPCHYEGPDTSADEVIVAGYSTRGRDRYAPSFYDATPGFSVEPLIRTAASGCPLPASLVTSSPVVSSPDAALPQSSSGLEAEHLELRRLVDQLTSDARLLQFTDQLFVANLSTIETPGGRTADCAIPVVVYCLPRPALGEIRNLVASLKAIVEVLEAVLKRFETEAVKKSKTYRSDSENEATLKIRSVLRKKFPFKAVYIESDSHVRHLISLVRRRVSTSTKVTGTCRPRAKLLTVADSSLPPPGSYYVVFASTNDVAAEESYTIFEHLEQQFTVRLSSSVVIVSTVPHHDVSMDHAVN
ncbi:hypothetical protein J6590_057693 [Homalodisca vitripennis]|nr:hypothetical protein J6590_057693 [Homalodisca vitripennis]